MDAPNVLLRASIGPYTTCTRLDTQRVVEWKPDIPQPGVHRVSGLLPSSDLGSPTNVSKTPFLSKKPPSQVCIAPKVDFYFAVMSGDSNEHTVHTGSLDHLCIKRYRDVTSHHFNRFVRSGDGR